MPPFRIPLPFTDLDLAVPSGAHFEALKPVEGDSTRTLTVQCDTTQMVNFLHNITALAGAATVCKIFDFRSSVLTIAGGLGEDGVAIQTTPTVAGATNQEWMIIPQATANTFTLQSVKQPAVFVSYAAAARKAPGHSQAVVSDAFPTIFEMVAVAGGPSVNLIDTASNMTLTAWAKADPAWTSTVTPLTMEALNTPNSFMQSFTIALCRYFQPIVFPLILN
ncbi:hypothetical protein B0H13DRAFT_1890100 [Mycena leptocephala]|nr:hypothetical protein B0H13DRAFT_1890100 [Mycena leptocephala]